MPITRGWCVTVPGAGWAPLAVPSIYSNGNLTASTHALNCCIGIDALILHLQVERFKFCRRGLLGSDRARARHAVQDNVSDHQHLFQDGVAAIRR
jgi:hypothetical protein